MLQKRKKTKDEGEANHAGTPTAEGLNSMSFFFFFFFLL